MMGDKAMLRASQWCYRGIWGVITKWLLVPEQPPHLTGADDLSVRAFRPAEGYLKYLKFYFWIGLVAIDICLIAGWLALLISVPLAGILIAPLAWAIIIVPDVIAYIAIHLRYDTTWYVLSDRTMRIRRGIWSIGETTITYENIQNVSLKQGPVQRYFGIADVQVQTAGGGSSHGKGPVSHGHEGVLEGVDNAEAIRALIMEKWRASKSAGLGDDAIDDVRQAAPVSNWSPAHVVMLGEIRDLAQELAQQSAQS
jgi:membrane protein YdbS with pleckstrin-like domain